MDYKLLLAIFLCEELQCTCITFLPSYTNILKRECLKVKYDFRFNTHAELS